MLRLLALLALVAFSVQAVDTDRIVKSAQKYGPTGVANAKALQQMMAALIRHRTTLTKLKAVNDFFNQRLAYMEDIDNWGVQDYWASPLESLGKGAGDCEDYAIGKYFTLTSLGVPHARSCAWSTCVPASRAPRTATSRTWCWPTIRPPRPSRWCWTT